MEDDAETLASWAVDAVFCAHAGWRLRGSPADAVPWWREAITRPDPKLMRLLALSADEPVGYVDLHGDDVTERELGYVIAPSTRWGRGLGTAAARAGLDYGFDQLGLSRIWAEAIEANVASMHVLQRLGMRMVGLGTAAEFLGVDSRYVQFELLSHEWATRLGLAAR